MPDDRDEGPEIEPTSTEDPRECHESASASTDDRGSHPPVPVRLLIVDLSEGFWLTPDSRLPDIPPGAMCTNDYRPQETIKICEIVVHGNFIVVLLEHPKLRARAVTTDASGRLHLYPPLIVHAGDCLRVHLRNDDPFPQPPRHCVAIKLHESRESRVGAAAQPAHQRSLVTLRKALQTILFREGDCAGWNGPGRADQPCECTVCLAKRALLDEEDWRFQGWKPARRSTRPRELELHAAWKRYFTKTASPANGTTAPMDLILAEILDVDVDTVSARDWYVATTVVQWLATNVGQDVLFDGGYQQKRKAST